MADSNRFAKEQRLHVLLLAMSLGAVITTAVVSLLGFESPGVLRLDYWEVAEICMIASIVVGFLLVWHGKAFATNHQPRKPE